MQTATATYVWIDFDGTHRQARVVGAGEEGLTLDLTDGGSIVGYVGTVSDAEGNVLDREALSRAVTGASIGERLSALEELITREGT